jgi:hypothetical protein
MSTSFIEYRGKGFWSFDGYLEHALALLADTIDERNSPPWLVAARQHWTQQASGVFRAWIHPQFDEFLTTEERQQVFLRLAEAVLGRDDLTPEAEETMRLVVRLIRGEIQTDASSPLDYMVQGNPYYLAGGLLAPKDQT